VGEWEIKRGFSVLGSLAFVLKDGREMKVPRRKKTLKRNYFEDWGA